MTTLLVAGEDLRGDAEVSEASFDVLVEKIEQLTLAVGKIEDRWEKRHEAEVVQQLSRDGRLRNLEIEIAITKTRVLWIVAGGSLVVSVIVSVVASLGIAWLGK